MTWQSNRCLVLKRAKDFIRKNEEKKADVSTSEAVAADPLAFKPNPLNLLNKDNDDEDEDVEDDDTNATGVYRPPKLAPVNYDENAGRKSGKKERDEARMKEKASRSRLMKDLMTEMSENPEEIGVFGGVNEGTGYGDRIDNVIAEKDRYEEDNYVRLAVTRKEKQRLDKNKKMRFESEFDVSFLCLELHLNYHLYCTFFPCRI